MVSVGVDGGIWLGVGVDVGVQLGIGVSVSGDNVVVTVSSATRAWSAGAIVLREDSNVGVWISLSRDPPQALLTNNHITNNVIFIRKLLK
jgi:hypothetical protein